MHVECVGDDEQVAVPRVPDGPFIALNGASFHAGQVGELVLRQACSLPQLGNAMAEGDATGLYPVGQRGAAWHSTNRRTGSIMCQYPNGRFLINGLIEWGDRPGVILCGAQPCGSLAHAAGLLMASRFELLFTRMGGQSEFGTLVER